MNKGASSSGMGYYSRFAEVEAWTRNLPHWDGPGLLTFATWRLADSLPAALLQTWRIERDAWIQLHPRPWDVETSDEYHAVFDDKLQYWLDQGQGSCLLRQFAVGKCVEDALLHFQDNRYVVTAYAVMPNHVHVLFKTQAGYSLDQVVQGWKSYTAHAINSITGQSGKVWQDEYWDRLIRSAAHYRHVCHYIAERNHGVIV